MTISVLFSVLSGVGGTLVLIIFCSTFIALEKLYLILPLFVAFNGALIGYKIVETQKKKIQNLSLFPSVMGIGGGAATFLILNFSGTFVNGFFPLGVSDLLIFMGVSGFTSYLGARLAVRYFNL